MRRWTIWSKAGSHPAAPLETRCREYGPLVDGGTRSGVGANQRGIATEGEALGRCAVHHEVEASAV